MEERTFKPHWSIENIEKFINLHKQHECLWNPELDSYKNFHSKKSALHKIVVEMRMTGLTTNIAKERIKSIRTMYRRELNKIVKSTKGKKYIYRPKLFWFEQIDSFLRPVAISRMGMTSLGNQGTSTSQNTEANEESEDNFLFQEQRADDDSTEDHSSNQIEDHRPTSIEQPRKKLKISVNDFYDHSEARMRNYNVPLQEEIFEVFGRLIAVHLKKLPLITAIECQEKIHSFVLNKSLEVLKNQNARNGDGIDILHGTSPLPTNIDIDYEEKPNTHQDILSQEVGVKSEIF